LSTAAEGGHQPATPVKSEELAYWYLRLNGFLSIPNFVVHPDMRGPQRTEVDILGVRFPHRAELLNKPMVDDKPFTEVQDKPYLIVAEVKRSECRLNGPWTEQASENMQRVLRAVGAFRDDEIATVAESLYHNGTFSNKAYHVSLFCFGDRENPDVRRTHPDVPQKLWSDVLRFVFNRFTTYRDQKAHHPQWDRAGTRLSRLAGRVQSVEQFISGVEVTD
jgi:hypothetical protein